MSAEQLAIHAEASHPRYYKAVMAGVMHPLLVAFGGLQHSGADVLNDIEGPGIVAGDHRSMLDPLAEAEAVREAAGLAMTFLVKDDLDIFGLRKLITYGDGIFVDRTDNSLSGDAIQQVEERMALNAIFGIFPEGTRMTGNTINIEKLRGVHLLAPKFGATVVPLGIAGTEKGRRGPIRLKFGDPIPVPRAENRRELASIARPLRQTMGTEIQRLFDDARVWSERDAGKGRFF